jgi:hypothetical protein
MVGIAGEDDLDAPDLLGAQRSDVQHPAIGGRMERNGAAAPGAPVEASERDQRSAGASRYSPARGRRKVVIRPVQPILEPSASESRRNELLSDLRGAGSVAAALNWAQATLKEKGRLRPCDAEEIETAFAARMAELQKSGVERERVASAFLTGEAAKSPVVQAMAGKSRDGYDVEDERKAGQVGAVADFSVARGGSQNKGSPASTAGFRSIMSCLRS